MEIERKFLFHKLPDQLDSGLRAVPSTSRVRIWLYTDVREMPHAVLC